MFDHPKAGVVQASFARVAQATACPFAVRARWREIHVPGPWPDGAGTVAAQLAARMDHFARELVDMVVVTITDPFVCADICGLANAVEALLRHLDPKAAGTDWEQELLDPGWRLWVGGVAVFPLAFAPFYPADHPRFSPSGAVHLVLQLEDSFTHHGISSGLQVRQRLSQFVRRCFEQRGITYLPEITAQPAKSLRLIKPNSDGDPPVRWWTGSKVVRGP